MQINKDGWNRHFEESVANLEFFISTSARLLDEVDTATHAAAAERSSIEARAKELIAEGNYHAKLLCDLRAMHSYILLRHEIEVRKKRRSVADFLDSKTLEDEEVVKYKSAEVKLDGLLEKHREYAPRWEELYLLFANKKIDGKKGLVILMEGVQKDTKELIENSGTPEILQILQEQLKARGRLDRKLFDDIFPKLYVALSAYYQAMVYADINFERDIFKHNQQRAQIRRQISDLERRLKDYANCTIGTVRRAHSLAVFFADNQYAAAIDESANFKGGDPDSVSERPSTSRQIQNLISTVDSGGGGSAYA